MGFGLCWACTKEKQRNGSIKPKIGKNRRAKTARDRLLKAASTYALADSPEVYERALDNLTKSAPRYTYQNLGQKVRKALRALAREGVKLGRPRKVDPEKVLNLVKVMGGARRVAEDLKVSVRTVKRAVSQARKQQARRPVRAQMR